MPKDKAEVEEPDTPTPANEANDEPQTDTRDEQIAQLTKETNELKDQLLRSLADHQNFRKRMQQEQAQLRQFATESLVRELLPVLDNFERTIAAVEQGASIDSLKDGIKAVDRQLRTALESQNVKRIASQGEVFDPEVHDAIVTVETHELPEGTIVNEIEAGYRMSDKVIRPARVRVAKKP